MCHFLRIGGTIERTDWETLADCGLLLEFSGYKRIEVGWDGIGAIAEDTLPSIGQVECRDKPRPDVGLVETREGRVGLVWQEDGIKVFFLTVESLIVAGKVYLYHVKALLHQLR